MKADICILKQCPIMMRTSIIQHMFSTTTITYSQKKQPRTEISQAWLIAKFKLRHIRFNYIFVDSVLTLSVLLCCLIFRSKCLLEQESKTLEFCYSLKHFPITTVYRWVQMKIYFPRNHLLQDTAVKVQLWLPTGSYI